jgi:hypothetical protein
LSEAPAKVCAQPGQPALTWSTAGTGGCNGGSRAVEAATNALEFFGRSDLNSSAFRDMAARRQSKCRFRARFLHGSVCEGLLRAGSPQANSSSVVGFDLSDFRGKWRAGGTPRSEIFACDFRVRTQRIAGTARYPTGTRRLNLQSGGSWILGCGKDPACSRWHCSLG